MGIISDSSYFFSLAGSLRNDLWELNPSTFTWHSLNSGSDDSVAPQGRAYLRLTNLHSSLYLFGGESEAGCTDSDYPVHVCMILCILNAAAGASGTLGDIWRWNLSAGNWSLLPYAHRSLLPRAGHGFTSLNNTLLISGGYYCNRSLESNSKNFLILFVGGTFHTTSDALPY
jgi:hypothetical protein